MHRVDAQTTKYAAPEDPYRKTAIVRHGIILTPYYLHVYELADLLEVSIYFL